MRTIFLLLLLAVLNTVHATPTPPSNFTHPPASIIDSLPTISCPPNATIGSNPNACSATHAYSVTASDDEPDWVLTQVAGQPSGSGFSLGATVNEFLVTDVDGNSASCSFTVTVKDYNPPIAVCHQNITVEIPASDDLNDCYLPNAPSGFASVVWIDVSVFDNGSFDQCNNSFLTIRRLPPYGDFIPTLNHIRGEPPCNSPFPTYPNEYERAISELDAMKFYCGEAGTTQTVALAVYQIEPDGSISVGPNGAPISNQCYIEVKVRDKVKPVCNPPAPAVVSCEQFDPSLLAYGQPMRLDNCCIDTITSSVNYSEFDTICNQGTITRVFSALDCSGNTSSCSQRVVVNNPQNYFVKFPNDTLVTACNSTGIYDAPSFFGTNCAFMAISYEDEVFGIQPVDACYKIERTWTAINWCTYDPLLPLTFVPNPNPNAAQGNPANTPGPIVSACGTPAPWAPTISKINPTDTVDTDFCTFWSTSTNGYRYKQIIKILDSAVPIVVNCPVSPLTFIDSTHNAPSYWNNVFNPALPAQNLRETEVELPIIATDACSAENVGIQYLLFLDLDTDGVLETVVDCDNPPPAGSVFYGNALLPNYSGGTLTEIDTRPVPFNEKWRFTVQKSFLGDHVRATVAWNTTQLPNTYVLPELPLGTHKINWIVLDGCGNESTCEYNFKIEPGAFECIPPAEVVISCEQFDPSLLAYGEPDLVSNCCIDTLIMSADYAQFDTLCSRGTITRVFNALDCCGNTSQCSQRVVVNYLQDYYIKFPNDVIVTNCNSTGVYGEPSFFGTSCELLSVTYYDEIIDVVPDACFRTERVWTIINWCTYDPVLPLINIPNPTPNPIVNNPVNLPGPTVSACGTPAPWTSTIVKISPTDPAATDYCTFWNANANGYRYKQTIKVIDSTAPNLENCPVPPSYFEDATQNDPAFWNNVFNPDLPAQDLREAPLELTVEGTDACSGSNVNIEYLLFLDLNANGQQETVVSSTNLGSSGLGWNNVQYNNINTPNYSGGTPTTFDNRGVPDNQKWGFAIQQTTVGASKTASVRWNTEQSPGVYVLPELPNGRHKIKWFITDGCGNNKECERIFYIGDSTLVGTNLPETAGFALYQNEPNPFSSSTELRFKLPEFCTATLSVFDAEGRILYRQTADYSPGEHAVTLEKDGLTPGVLFYKLETGANMAWRKMVLLR